MQDHAPFYKAAICSELGEVWKFDRTYQCVSNIACRISSAGRSIHPFKSFCSVMNEYAVVMWYGFQTTENAWADLEPHFRRLLQRHRRHHADEAWHPSAVYVDNCCPMRGDIQQSMGMSTPVCLDPYHWFDWWDDTVNVPAGSILHCLFNAELRDAVLIPEKDDYANEKARLEARTGWYCMSIDGLTSATLDCTSFDCTSLDCTSVDCNSVDRTSPSTLPPSPCPQRPAHSDLPTAPCPQLTM